MERGPEREQSAAVPAVFEEQSAAELTVEGKQPAAAFAAEGAKRALESAWGREQPAVV